MIVELSKEFIVYQGDSLEILKTFQENSVNCCVTSPPYFGLRNYGHDQQIGLEESPEEYIQKLVDVFQEVKRVMTDDGTLWINIGDSYAREGKHSQSVQTINNRVNGKFHDKTTYLPQNHKVQLGNIKNKDLMGIPWMLAFALRNNGWYLRSEIIWNRPNNKPESVKDRPTKAHEQIFLLTKSPTYFYDYDAIKESSKSEIGTKNKRSVWDIYYQNSNSEHTATFPMELPETCILAGCPKDGIVLDPFSGSGTTGLAAINNQRKYIGIELNPSYIEATKKRFVSNIKSDASLEFLF